MLDENPPFPMHPQQPASGRAVTRITDPHAGNLLRRSKPFGEDAIHLYHWRPAAVRPNLWHKYGVSADEIGHEWPSRMPPSSILGALLPNFAKAGEFSVAVSCLLPP